MCNSLFENVNIETNRLNLRCFTLEDKEEFYKIIQDPILYETSPEDHMYNREEVDEIIDWFVSRYSKNIIGNIPKFPLAIVLKDEGNIIGNIGIGHYMLDKSKMEIFYFINSGYWHKGYTSEAIEAFLEYIKENHMVDSLIGTVVDKNVASKKILTKNGFKKIEHNYDDKREMYLLELE